MSIGSEYSMQDSLRSSERSVSAATRTQDALRTLSSNALTRVADNLEIARDFCKIVAILGFRQEKSIAATFGLLAFSADKAATEARRQAEAALQAEMRAKAEAERRAERDHAIEREVKSARDYSNSRDFYRNYQDPPDSRRLDDIGRTT